MVNRPKAIGTAGETGVRNYLLSLGFSPLQAHRNVLKGAADEGDVWLRIDKFDLIVFEVKSGKTAQSASHEQVNKWMDETEREAANAGGDPILVVARKGYSPKRAGEWWAYRRRLTASNRWVLCRLTLDEMIDDLNIRPLLAA